MPTERWSNPGSTELLDAGAQFVEGRKRLEAGQLASAVEHFQYAVDIEPTGRALAYLALAPFRMAPDFAAQHPDCEEAWAFRADLAMSLSEAEETYRHAARLHHQAPFPLGPLGEGQKTEAACALGNAGVRDLHRGRIEQASVPRAKIITCYRTNN